MSNKIVRKSAKDSFESILKIAKKLKNPCYILEESKLQENLEILASVRAQSGAKILLALKGFAFWSSFKMVAKYLDGITASGYYEARLGLEEFRKHNKKAIISVFSPAFTACEIKQIAPFANHIIFNSFNQFVAFRKFAKKTHLALRLNPLYSEVTPEIYNPCAPFSRLGIVPDEFEKGVKAHGLKGIKGLHFHTHCEQNSDALERTIEAIERHFGKYIAQMEWINFGGGHHITRKDYDLNRLVRVISRFRKKYGVEVILEPGEAVGWQCGVLVGEVVDIVRNGVDIAITNLSAATQMPDCLEMPYTPEILGARIVSNSSLDLFNSFSGNHSAESNTAHDSQSNNRSNGGVALRCFDAERAKIGLGRPLSEVSYQNNANEYPRTNCKQYEAQSKKVLIIGGGPNRIGQGIEFDYCCVHSSFALKDLGIQSIMYNCNPETVSTDYDTSDTLYFEPIDFERVRAVVEREKPDGIIVHFGGQTPLKLAKNLTTIGAKIIGTKAAVIDTAEDREKFAAFAKKLNLNQPQNGSATSKDGAFSIARKIGYPALVRPSYVLGGRAMRIVQSDEELNAYMDEAVKVSESSPVLVDKFLDHATELDVDAICDGKEVYIGGIMQHIEEAGVHSGDSASCLPPFGLDSHTIKEVENLSAAIAIELGVIGLLNIQFAIFQNTIYIIEVNPRASRTVPFVSKATGIPLAKVATRVMWNHAQNPTQKGILRESLKFYDSFECVDFNAKPMCHKHLNHISVKESVFPFSKLSGADLILGPEMKSTGEVMGISRSFAMSFAKSQIASKNVIPLSGNVLLSVADEDKPELPRIAKGFIKLGFKIYATGGSFDCLEARKIPAHKVLKISEGRPNIHDLLMNNEICLLVNTSDNKSSKDDARQIRAQVVRLNLPYFTTIAGTAVALQAIKELRKNSPNFAKPLQEYLGVESTLSSRDSQGKSKQKHTKSK